MTVTNLSIDNLKVRWTYDGVRYRTDSHGEGLWMINKHGLPCRQIMGDCDFRLRGTIGAIRAKLNRMYIRDREPKDY